MSPARRFLFCVVLFSSLAQEAGSLSSGLSVPPRGPAFLTAPRLPQSSSWAAGAPIQWCRRSPRVPHAALARSFAESSTRRLAGSPHSPRVLPAALVPCGITPDPRNVPWALHAIGGGGQGASATKNNAAWDQRLEELRLFKEIHGGDAEVSRKNLEWPGLGVWCNRQRQFEKTGKMRLDRKVRLLQIGFVFDRQEAAWEQSFEELRVLAEANGGVAHVSQNEEGRVELGTWCHTQRALNKKEELRADRKARLFEIGFVFDPLEAAWDQSYEELRLFAKANRGVAHVSQKDPERAALGRWCTDQPWATRFAKANRGVARVSQKHAGRAALGRWCTGQRARVGTLREDRKTRLLEIGFVFDLQEVARLKEESFEKLRLSVAEAQAKQIPILEVWPGAVGAYM